MAFDSLRSRAVIIVVSMFVVALLGFIDLRTGHEISVSVFYLVPVLVVAWFAGWWPAVVLSVFAGVVWFWVELYSGQVGSNALVPVWNAFVRLVFFIFNGYLAAQVHVHLKREQLLARQDTLTGALNGYAFLEEAERFLALARRKKQTFTLVYLDLDNFKAVNDTLGHVEGNRVLCAVAETLRRSTRQYDIVARLGGDEFGIMLPETDVEEAEGCVRKVCDVLEKEVAARRWPVSFSVGVATFRELPNSMSEALNAADTLMYRVKRTGKRGVLREIWPFEMNVPPSLPAQEEERLVAARQVSLHAH